MKPRRLWLLILFFTTLIVGRKRIQPSAITTTEKPQIYAVLNQNSVLPYSPIYNAEIRQPMASKSGGTTREELLEGINFKTLISCLIEKESSFNEKARGDQNQSFGVLQFYKPYESDSLWQQKCVRDYGFSDVWSARQQILCCDRLLEEDFNYVFRWSVAERCLISK